MAINMIVAVDQNGAIGYLNNLLFKSKQDMKFFKTMTIGSVVIMGRKTHESIGKKLPMRTNVVVTRQEDYKPLDERCIVVNSVEEAVERFKGEHCFVIGGEEIYRSALPYTKRVYITTFHKAADKADSHFPVNQIRSIKSKSVGEINEDGLKGSIILHKLF